MPYSITTKDGITINNIPDDVAPDSPDLKARVAAIRAGSATAQPSAQAASAQVTPTQQVDRDKDAIPILMRELQTAQTKAQAGDPRAQSDIDAIGRELARKGVTVDLGAIPALSPASSPIAAPIAAPAPAPAAPAPAAQPQMGFFEGLSEQITGARRATPETQTLPEWTSMPEMNQMNMASFKSALGTMMSNPKETVQILQANFPGVQVRQDAKGNYLLRSSVDQKEYAITPGLTMGDIPRAIGGIAAFTPAGAARTIPGAILGSGATQAAIEASQAATGGNAGLGELAEIGMAAATGPAGQILQRVGAPVVQAVKSGAQRVMARPGPAPAPRVEPTFEAPPVTPEAPPVAPTAAPPVTPAAAPTATTTVTTEVVNNLVQKASGTGFGAAAARNKLADLAQINVGAKEAADRLGIKLPATYSAIAHR
jgi:hypothetical protein